MAWLIVRKDVALSQSKGCLAYIQVGCTGIYVRTPWTRNRDSAAIHAEIDTPFQRLRIGVHLCQRKNSRRYVGFSCGMKPNQQVGNSYRDRWLKKTGRATA